MKIVRILVGGFFIGMILFRVGMFFRQPFTFQNTFFGLLGIGVFSLFAWKILKKEKPDENEDETTDENEEEFDEDDE